MPSPFYAEAKAAFDAAIAAAIATIADAVPRAKVMLQALGRSTARQEPAAPDRAQDPDEPIERVLQRLAFEHRAGVLLDRALALATAEGPSRIPAGPSGNICSTCCASPARRMSSSSTATRRRAPIICR